MAQYQQQTKRVEPGILVTTWERTDTPHLAIGDKVANLNRTFEATVIEIFGSRIILDNGIDIDVSRLDKVELVNKLQS